MSAVDHTSHPAYDQDDLPPGTLAELFVTAVEKYGDRLAYQYIPDESSHLEGITFDEVYEIVGAADDFPGRLPPEKFRGAVGARLGYQSGAEGSGGESADRA